MIIFQVYLLGILSERITKVPTENTLGAMDIIQTFLLEFLQELISGIVQLAILLEIFWVCFKISFWKSSRS